MTDEKISLEPTATFEPAEPVYILPPHPQAHSVSNEEIIMPEEPTVADETLTDLVQQAVAGLRGELKAELQSELQISRGGLLDVKNSELPIG